MRQNVLLVWRLTRMRAHLTRPEGQEIQREPHTEGRQALQGHDEGKVDGEEKGQEKRRGRFFLSS